MPSSKKRTNKAGRKKTAAKKWRSFRVFQSTVDGRFVPSPLKKKTAQRKQKAGGGKKRKQKLLRDKLGRFMSPNKNKRSAKKRSSKKARNRMDDGDSDDYSSSSYE